MIGIFTNTFAIVLASLLGGGLKKGISDKYQASLIATMGLVASGIGLHTAITSMSDSKFPVLFIVSLALGTLIGTIIDLETKFDRLLTRFSLGNLGTGLSTAILLFCFGSLSILGPIESALNHNYNFLFTNATLDFITTLALASTYGGGIIFSAGVLFLWQSTIYLGANFLAPFLTHDLMTEISIIGGFLILASGLKILEIKEFKSLNMLPSLLIPILWFILKYYF